MLFYNFIDNSEGIDHSEGQDNRTNIKAMYFMSLFLLHYKEL